MYNKARKKNHRALIAFDKFGEYVAEELAIIVESIAPEMIILGGSVSKSFRFFNEAMFKKLKELIPEHQFKKLKVKKSTLRNAGILGAAMLYKEYLHR
jgi:glucokinase